MMWLCLSTPITGIPATSFPNYYQQATVPLNPQNDGRQVILHSSRGQRSVAWEGPTAGRVQRACTPRLTYLGLTNMFFGMSPKYR